MHTSNVAAKASGNAGLNQKVEVVVENQGGIDFVALKYLTWTDGLGWCCQKTIRVAADQLDELHREITVARHRVIRRRVANGEKMKPAQIIQLPSLT